MLLCCEILTAPEKFCCTCGTEDKDLVYWYLSTVVSYGEYVWHFCNDCFFEVYQIEECVDDFFTHSACKK